MMNIHHYGLTYFTGENVKFHVGFWQKMPNFTEISRKVISCFFLKPQNHLPGLIHEAYLRYLKNQSTLKSHQRSFYCSLICCQVIR